MKLIELAKTLIPHFNTRIKMETGTTSGTSKEVIGAGEIKGKLAVDLADAFISLKDDPEAVTTLWLGILKVEETRKVVQDWYKANKDVAKVILDGATVVARSGKVEAAGFNWGKALGME